MSEPVATVVLNTYQQVQLAPLALRSVLAQEGEPLHILASDDASTDGTWEALQQVASEYQGPHTLTLRRNETNLGTNHVPAILPLVTTPFVIRAHGDDVSRPHRARRLLEEWRRTKALLIGSNADQIDLDGRPMGRYRTGPVGPIDARTLLANGFRPEFLGATLAFERRLVEAPFGVPAPAQVHGGLDVILPIRAALLGQCAYIDEPLIEYRRHKAQASWQITDATGERLAFDEGLRAHSLPFRLQALRDLGALRKAHPKQRELDQLQGLAIDALLGEVQQWAGLRTQLMGRGMRPSWMTREEAIQMNAARDAKAG